MGNRCFACMNIINSGKCSYCNYENTDTSYNKELEIKPGTVLLERFYIGLKIDQNGEGTTYIAYDMLEKVRVRVRELFPSEMCIRNVEGNIISKDGYDIQFKTLKDDFIELHKQIIDLKSAGSLLKTKMLFSKNNTIYAVIEDVVGISLNNFLINNAEELTWQETESIFLPLLNTIRILNSHNITHKGISPKTIIITEDKQLKLSGVCTSSIRAVTGELPYELFKGYSAPEQYKKCVSVGEWTDVYSISAVLYKVLTGVMPPSFEVRTPEQVITSPIEIVDSIPLNISNAIMRGLDYSCHNRTQYIRDLISDLYSKNNQQYVLQEKRDNQENNEYSFSEQTIQIDTIKNVIKKSDTGEIKMAKKNKKRIPIWLIAILITLPIMLGLFLIIYKDMFGEIPIGNSSDSSSVSSLNSEFIIPSSNVQEESSKAETSSEILTNSVVVDDFVNKLYEDINTSTAYQDMLSFIVTEEFSETVPVGMIFGQSIEKGSIVEQGSSIELKVSKGSQYVLIPPITDENGEKIKLEDYVTYLNDNGLEYEIVKMENGSYLKDEIISLNITEGEYVDRAVTTSVTIYVAE